MGKVYIMNRILCSTGALIGRPNGRNFRLLGECAEKLDCDGFEFMMYDDWYGRIDEVAGYLLSISKPFPAFHIEKGVGECVSRNETGDTEKALELFEANCKLAQKIGSKLLVLHLWNGEHSDKDFPHNAEVYAVLRDIADRYGLILTVENVVCNVADPMTHLSQLLSQYPDISFTFDTKMAEFHGQMDSMYLEENREIMNHIVHMHINDYKGAVMDWSCLKTLHIGEGQIDFNKLFDFLEKQEINYEGDFTIESTSFDKTGYIDFDRMNRSIAAIRKYLRS